MLVIGALMLMSPSALAQIHQTTAIPAVDVPSAPKIEPDFALQTGLGLAFGILGGVCLLIIIIQAMRFVLSGGNSEKTAQAQRGIIYAVVGLVVALAGSSVTRFVLDYFNPDPDFQLVGADSLFVKIAGLLTFILVTASIIMIVIAGIRYSLSGGNKDKTTSARNTIIYAVVGLVIAAVAGPIISLVVGLVT